MRAGPCGLVSQQQVHHQRAGLFSACAISGDIHIGRWMAATGGCEHTLALDLDHAGAAIAIGAIAMRITVTQMRDRRSTTFGHLPDGLIGLRLDLLPVEQKANGFTHD